MNQLSAVLLALVVAGRVAAQDEPVLIELPPAVTPNDVSANGFTVVGSILGAGVDTRFPDQGFYWTPTTGVMPIGGTTASAVSADGRTIAGRALDVRGNENAAIWLGGTEWRLLRPLSADAQDCDRLLSGTLGMNDDGTVLVGPFGTVGQAFGTNSDGSLVVGQNCDPLRLSAWSWRPDRGVTCHELDVPITATPYITKMFAASEDGSVIGGTYSFGLDAEAVVWLDEEPHFLQDYLRENGVPDAFKGWINTGVINGVSRDGRVLVGWGAGPTNFTGYIVVLP